MYSQSVTGFPQECEIYGLSESVPSPEAGYGGSGTKRTIEHPLIQHRLTALRDRETSRKTFRALLDEIAMLMGYDVTKDLPLQEVEVETPLERTTGSQGQRQEAHAGPHPPRRPGHGRGHAPPHAQRARRPHRPLPRARHAAARGLLFKIPPDPEARDFIVLDPMLATGGSAVAAVPGCSAPVEPLAFPSHRARSSVGQSSGLIIQRSQVRALPGPLDPGTKHRGDAMSRNATPQSGAVRAHPAPDCYLCRTPGRVLHPGVGDRIAAGPGTWDIRQCPACRLAWLDPRPLPEDVPLLYAGDYYTRQQAAPPPKRSAGLRAALHDTIRRDVLGYTDVPRPRGGTALAGSLLGRLPPFREMALLEVLGLAAERRGRLLDVGCGAGDFLARMRDLGWSVEGLEPDPAAARLAARAHDLTVHVGQLPHAALVPGTFEVITLHHVLEHLPDPIATLRAARALLRPGGSLVLVTPNLASLGRRAFGQAWLHWDPPRHLFLFEPDNLAAALRSAGFLPVTLQTPSRQARWSFGASRRIRRDGAFRPADPARLTRAERLGGVLFHALEAAFPRAARLGEEIYAVARPL
jgi:SAM-dependent methyltransferase